MISLFHPIVYEQSERPSEGAAELALFWGADLSRTLQDAGGVSDLVAVSVDDGFHYSDAGNREMAKVLFGKIIGFVTDPNQFISRRKK